jgi:hypothetical protein
MWQGYIFGVHWSHEGKMYYDELPADSKEAAAGYFIGHKRDDVSLIRVEMVGPNEGGVREFARFAGLAFYSIDGASPVGC